jgi:Lon protease-like protein
MFPLGGIVYTPNSNHVLNIFEPRYRQMYNDILMNGSKRFVVTMSHPQSPGKFAEIGVVFHLEDLKEVSEMTGDRVKYICDHKVTGRVKVHRILNPEAWASRDTYLKVEGTILQDSEDDEADSDFLKGAKLQAASGVGGLSVLDTDEEKALKKSFTKLVDLQHELQEDVRFTKSSAATLKVKPGVDSNSLWETVRLWQAYSDNRLQARQNELQQEFQTKLLKFLTDEKKLKEDEIPRLAQIPVFLFCYWASCTSFSSTEAYL